MRSCSSDSQLSYGMSTILIVKSLSDSIVDQVRLKADCDSFGIIRRALSSDYIIKKKATPSVSAMISSKSAQDVGHIR